MVVPHDDDAERFVIGSCLITRDAIAQVVNIVTAADFHRPAHAATFHAITAAWHAGEPVDPYLIADVQGGLTASKLIEAVSSVPATGHAAKYARIVVDHKARRALVHLGNMLKDAAENGDNPAEIIETARAGLASVDLPTGNLPDDLYRLSDMLARPEAERAPWVVPGLLRKDWRVIVVAPEGAGKSLVLQQVGIAAARGVHPFAFTEIPAQRVLFVDLENPEDRIVHGARLIDPHARRLATVHDDDNLWVWNRQGGINLRNRSDVATLEAVLTHVRPQLVCFGPAYKASQRDKNEGWDDSAMAVQRVLDQLRGRFGFALLMEDHAPQANSNGIRELRPFGSSAWLRWPEVGIKLAPDDPNHPKVLTLARWRGDRLPNSWPDQLHRGEQWPWVGRWEHGSPQLKETA